MKRGPNIAAAVGVLTIFVASIVIFVLPFAFPTPPPIVQQFLATQRFSPNGDGNKDVARISIRLNEAATVRLLVLDSERRLVRVLAGDVRQQRSTKRRPFSAPWGGRADSGRALPDGEYTLQLLARKPGSKKRFNKARRVVIDTSPAAIEQFTVASASFGDTSSGQCRTSVRVEPNSSVSLSAVRAGKTFDQRGPFGKTEVRWAWDGRPGGRPLTPAVYRIVAVATDAAGNRRGTSRTCWVGHLVGRPLPSGPRPGGLIRAGLESINGKGISGSTVVTLRLFRRIGSPGDGSPTPIGNAVGRPVRGPVGRTRIRLPLTIPPKQLWLMATTGSGRALIPLGR